MIEYDIKINGVIIKSVHITRLRAINESMEKDGYEYKFIVYDFENERFKKGTVMHKRQDHEGILLDKVLSKIN